MKRYSGVEDVWNEVDNDRKGGWKLHLIDKYHIQVLERNRKAAMFAIPIMLCMIMALKKRKEKSIQNYISSIEEVISICKAVANDKSIYVAADTSDIEASRELEEEARKSDRAVGRASNVCNNLPPGFLDPDFHDLVLQARDVCMEAILGKRFHL